MYVINSGEVVAMAYVALYRQWRPQDFDALVGQKAVKTTLKNALASGKIAHAYLFSGPRGTGKTSMARILAKSRGLLPSPVVSAAIVSVLCREPLWM